MQEQVDWYYEAPEAFLTEWEESRRQCKQQEEEMRARFVAPPQSKWGRQDRVKIGDHPFMKIGEAFFKASPSVTCINFDVFRELSEMYEGRHELIKWSRSKRTKFVFENGRLDVELEGEINWVPKE